MSNNITILWFDEDLRLQDNPALLAAVDAGQVLPIFIYNQKACHPLGEASRWWLHHSLQALDESLSDQLNYYTGDAYQTLLDICQRLDIKSVCWNRRYQPWKVSRDAEIKQRLEAKGIQCQDFAGALLREPQSILKKDGTPYKVFTPFYRYATSLNTRAMVISTVSGEQLQRDCKALALDELALLPSVAWYNKFEPLWQPGEEGAHKALNRFISHYLHSYETQRDFPESNATSNLASHIHFGEISMLQIINALPELTEGSSAYIRQLYWREFSYYLLHYFPSMHSENLKPQFNDFAWRNDPVTLRLWQQGLTGYPLVDAGMRELWQTGYMHNRVRMIVASFLVKNLLIDWRLGAQWFWDCLCDADLANNSASWQWVAGCGMDAAPFFRIFNPTAQAKKFDPNGDYIRRFVPELALLPAKYLYEPWSAPQDILDSANIKLGIDYPHPIVKLDESRERALAENRRISKKRAHSKAAESE